MKYTKENLLRGLKRKLCPFPRNYACRLLNNDIPMVVGSEFYCSYGEKIKVLEILEHGRAEVAFRGNGLIKRCVISYRANLRHGGVRNPYRVSVAGAGYDGDLSAASDRDLLSFCRIKWTSMLRRVVEDPTYRKVNVSEEFKCLANFYNWAKAYEDTHGKIDRSYELDKDLLGDGTIYSSKSCMFIPGELNRAICNFSCVYLYHFRPTHANFYTSDKGCYPLGSNSTFNILNFIHSEKLRKSKEKLQTVWDGIKRDAKLPAFVFNTVDKFLNLEIDLERVKESVREVNRVIADNDTLDAIRYKLEFLNNFQGSNPVELDSFKIRKLLFYRDSPYRTKGVHLTDKHIIFKLSNSSKRIPHMCLTDEFFFEQAEKTFRAKLKWLDGFVDDVCDLEVRLKKYLGYDRESLTETLKAIRNP